MNLKRLWMVVLLFMVGMVSLSQTSLIASSTLEPLVKNGTTVTHYNSNDAVMVPTTYNEKSTEFRGVWVATVYNLNMPIHTSETQYKQAFDDLIARVVAKNMNAIVFQVRSKNDAFYDSEYAPWSQYVTGTEGVDPGWDIMQYMIDTAHAAGIEFHAWLNPYRVTTGTTSKSSQLANLHDENFAKQRPDLVIADTSNKLILNPGEPEVKTYITDVVDELITLYDVDGIHFDDYFYPYGGLNSDGATYSAYNPDSLSLGDWRRENVNDVVESVYNTVEGYNTINDTTIRFGISPFGLWASEYDTSIEGGSNTSAGNTSSYQDQYADSLHWVEQGWLHYINPQIYWSFTHSTAPYADVVDWWASVVRGTNVDLIIGHAISSADIDNWDTDEISDQLLYNQQYPEIVGEMMYSASYLNKEHMTDVNANYWTMSPLSTWVTSSVDSPIITVTGNLDNGEYRDDVTIDLTGASTLYYKINDSAWSEYTEPITLTEDNTYAVYAKTIDSNGDESAISSEEVVIHRINDDIPSISINGDMIGDNYLLGSTVSISSDIEDVYVAVNHGSVGAWQPYTEPLVLDDTGNYYIQAKTIDSDGTESEIVTLSVKVQAECYDEPIIAIDGDGTYPYFKEATVSFTTSAEGLEYQINNGGFHVYTTPFDLLEEGEYVIAYRNQDGCQDIYSDTIIIDQTPPDEATLTIIGDYDGERYYTSTTSLELVTDEVYTDIYFRLHNGSSWSDWTTFTDLIELQFSGTYTLEWLTMDQAGNISDTSSERIRLDIPPREDNMYVIRDGEQVTYYNSSTPIELPTEYVEKSEEVRAVWVATVGNIDIKQHSSEQDYKNTIIAMLDEIERNNLNTIFFQVRPMNDAFYDSDYAPWSRYLTGTEGVDPGWDVMEFIIEESHRRGIELHAWLNPYRVSSSTDSKATQLARLHDENFAKQNPDLVLQDNSNKLILNPGSPQVQSYITNVIRELIGLYDVDGIHFDDYFYSYNGMDDTQDAETYNQYKEAGQSLADWRRENVNTIIRDIYDAVELHNTTNDKTVEFGISPFGIWKSGGEDGSDTATYALQSYSDQYADTKRWVEEGWVHYILPQLYWEFNHSAAPFADLVDWWANLTEENNVDLIIGHGFYRYDDDSWDNQNELLEQLRYISQYDSVIGSSLFSYRTFLSYDEDVIQAKERLNTYYWATYATFPWESIVEKQEEDNEIPVITIIGEPTVTIPLKDTYTDQGATAYDTEDGDITSSIVVDNPVDTSVAGTYTVTYNVTDSDGANAIEVTRTVIVEEPVVCDDDQTLIDGECVDDEVTCDAGYELVEGECVLITEDDEQTGCFSGIALSTGMLLSIIGLGFGVLFFVRKPSQ